MPTVACGGTDLARVRFAYLSFAYPTASKPTNCITCGARLIFSAFAIPLGNPTGIPATATPAAPSRSLSRLLMAIAGTWPSTIKPPTSAAWHAPNWRVRLNGDGCHSGPRFHDLNGQFGSFEMLRSSALAAKVRILLHEFRRCGPEPGGRYHQCQNGTTNDSRGKLR